VSFGTWAGLVEAQMQRLAYAERVAQRVCAELDIAPEARSYGPLEADRELRERLVWGRP
jgi:hypothetical protein